MIPLPHRNTIKFFGMGKKKDYLLWHQSHGTFTALNKKFEVQMWSTVTGKILQSQEADPNEETKKEERELRLTTRQYSVYQAGSNDQTYMREWNRTDARSFSLVISDDLNKEQKIVDSNGPE